MAGAIGLVAGAIALAAAVVVGLRSGPPPPVPEAPPASSSPASVPAPEPTEGIAAAARAPRRSAATKATAAPETVPRPPLDSSTMPPNVDPGPAAELPASPSLLGSLSVTADAWMLVSVDGGAAEQTPFRFDRLAAGTHVVYASREGYKDIRIEVQTRAGEAHRLTLTPERASP